MRGVKISDAVFIMALLFSLLASTLIVEKVQAVTEVSGIITSDTTWTKANSSYSLTDPVAINQGVKLTKTGEKIALEVIRHHRLIEVFLSEALGVPWDKVHEEAEKWEHVLSEEMEDRIDKLLGFPTSDPHGSPIPKRNGEMNDNPTLRLSDLKIGEKATIAEVNDLDPELLRYVGKLGLYPETKICINDIAPFDGPFEIRAGNQELTVGRKAANHILVKDIEN